MRAVNDIETGGVVGAGTMGAGIAQTAAQHGYEAVVRDVTDDLVTEGLERVERGSR